MWVSIMYLKWAEAGLFKIQCPQRRLLYFKHKCGYDNTSNQKSQSLLKMSHCIVVPKLSYCTSLLG